MVDYFIYSCNYCDYKRAESPANESAVVMLHGHTVTHVPGLDIMDFILVEHYTWEPID